jgi:hypothetical protein
MRSLRSTTLSAFTRRLASPGDTLMNRASSALLTGPFVVRDEKDGSRAVPWAPGDQE